MDGTLDWNSGKLDSIHTSGLMVRAACYYSHTATPPATPSISPIWDLSGAEELVKALFIIGEFSEMAQFSGVLNTHRHY